MDGRVGEREGGDSVRHTTHGLAELLRHTLEVAERDVTSLIVIEEVEDLESK